MKDFYIGLCIGLGLTGIAGYWWLVNGGRG